MKKTAVVILNWNGKKWLEQFLPSVTQYSSQENIEIVVIDNASTDDSCLFLEKEYPQIRQIVLDQNYGFTGGYNRGLAQVAADYFVLLNSDIEVTENWIEPIISRMEANPKIAACQPKILAYNEKSSFEYAGACGGFIDFLGYPFCRGRIFDSLEKDTGQYDTAQSVFWATGACLFVRADLYKQLGGLDEDFFAHMEEIDLCWRLQNLGYEIWVEPSSKVYHVGGGTLSKSNPRKTFLNFRNNLAMILKNERLWIAFLKITARLYLDGISGFKYLLSGNFKDTFAIARAHFSFYRMIPSLLKKRSSIPCKKMSVLKGVYSRSIVWQYFVKKIHSFSGLCLSEGFNSI